MWQSRVGWKLWASSVSASNACFARDEPSSKRIGVVRLISRKPPKALYVRGVALGREPSRLHTAGVAVVGKMASIPRAAVVCRCMIFFFLHPIYYPRTTLALPPSSNSDPELHSGPSSPLPTAARSFIFIARRVERFLPSSTRVELCSKNNSNSSNSNVTRMTTLFFFPVHAAWGGGKTRHKKDTRGATQEVGGGGEGVLACCLP